MAQQQVLVEVEPVERVKVGRVPAAVAGTKVFRDYDQHQSFLLPPSLLDWLPEDHLARVIDSLVDNALDLSVVLASYDGPTR